MKKFIVFLFISFLPSIILFSQDKNASRQVISQTNQSAELAILSLNNSLIDYNDQPSMFNELAAAGGKKAIWTKQTRLGRTLQYHYEEGEGETEEGPCAKMVIRSKPWTHIILQEQSSKPLTDPADFLQSVKMWIEYIKTHCPNPDAEIILTMNWAYQEAADFAGDTKNLYKNYRAAAKELDITLCPVGNAYESIREIDGEEAKNALYTDNRHPTPLASYLSACMIYSTLFNQTPVGLSYYPSSISSEDAARMQTRAWNAYKANLANKK